ncbi:MAG: multicopper oxidase family protein [Phreatobacter sp.]|uniref:multicopper oxidase family protein n=1 Tax=Phreatobacter sp. TaxID=1966341 RepID=UPI001A58D107|nr:multicopper oxidase family protein [Phreatobacter sp.]MBL8569991.1 multicopper oxidase family protein [Phreatobacter sp.]
MSLPLRLDRRTLLSGLALAVPVTMIGAPRVRAQPHPASIRAQRLEPGPDRSLLSYDAAGIPPVLRARRGEAFSVRLANNLAEATSLHWHGLRLPAASSDTFAPSPLAAGATADLTITPRDAGAFLYHPGLVADGPRQMRDGLGGILLVDHPAPPADTREIVLHLAETAPREGAPHRILVNGRPELALQARAGERLWLRLANATPHRLIQFAAPDQALTLVALDSQPCEPFRLDGGRLVLGPGQRAETMWDVTGPPGTSVPISLAQLGGGSLAGALAIANEAPTRGEALPPPEPLPANPLPQTLDFRRAQRLDLALQDGPGGELLFGGRADTTPAASPAFRARRGSVVMVALKNETDRFCAVHWHGHPARLLDNMDDGWKPFFIDTVICPPRSTNRIAFLAETPGRWRVTCQAINAEPGPRMIWFEVS